MSLADTSHISMSKMYMKTLLNMFLIDMIEDKLSNKYVELFILNGYIDAFHKSNEPNKLLCQPNIIKCKDYPMLIKKVIDQNPNDFYGALTTSINDCKIGATMTNNIDLLNTLKKQFPDKPNYMRRSILIPSYYGHFDNSLIESVFDQIDMEECCFCAKVGLNRLVKMYMQNNYKPTPSYCGPIPYYRPTPYYESMCQAAGVGGNTNLLIYIKKHYPNLLVHYVYGLIYGDHLDKLKILYNDNTYAINYTQIKINFEKLIKKKISSEMIFYCMENLEVIMPEDDWNDILKLYIPDDIIEYITPLIPDTSSQSIYLTKAHHKSIKKMLELAYALPLCLCANYIKIRRLFLTEPYLKNKYLDLNKIPEFDTKYWLDGLFQKKLTYFDLSALIQDGYVTTEDFKSYLRVKDMEHYDSEYDNSD
jgi:hypothetical protein